MRLLLDTHILLWWWKDSADLTRKCRQLIIDSRNEILVSAASAWEIGTKVRLGRLDIAMDLEKDFNAYLARDRFLTLAVSADHGLRAGALPGPHRDPFDRMLIAQAQTEDITLASNEEVFDDYGIRRIW